MNHKTAASSEDSYLQLLNRISLLLDRNGYAAESGLTARLVAALENGSPPSVLASNEIWGGSGSVTDCNLLSTSGPQSKEAARLDHAEFCSLIARLAAKLKSDGYADPRVASVGETYS